MNEEYAHPQVTSSGITGGMTLRDWFAGQALAEAIRDRGCNESYADIAKHTYRIADAMMEARKK